MFRKWDVFKHIPFQDEKTISETEILVFPGGADLNPGLYGEKKHPTTSSSDKQDDTFLKAWNLVVKNPKILKIGICGGGQFLNVMNGGKMFQDVDNHTRDHSCVYLNTVGETSSFQVTSTHHQMMRPGREAELWGWAFESSYRDLENTIHRPTMFDHEGPDIEVLWYPKTSSLCFQPHPEYANDSCRNLFIHCFARVCNIVEFKQAA
jgi:hypothetical protein